MYLRLTDGLWLTNESHSSLFPWVQTRTTKKQKEKDSQKTEKGSGVTTTHLRNRKLRFVKWRKPNKNFPFLNDLKKKKLS